jgi:hypothetical protein
MLPGPFLDFRDPRGNRVEIVGYDGVQQGAERTTWHGPGAPLQKRASDKGAH